MGRRGTNGKKAQSGPGVLDAACFTALLSPVLTQGFPVFI
jgi:hypothetical protein